MFRCYFLALYTIVLYNHRVIVIILAHYDPIDMHRTLDSLIDDISYKNTSKPQKKTVRLPVFLQEIKLFWAIFIAMFFGMLVFTNANLFMHALGLVHNDYDNQSLAFAQEIDSMIVDSAIERKQDAILEKYKDISITQNPVATNIGTVLENKLAQYDFNFNTLPPVDRLVVDGIALDVPLISVTEKSEGDFVRGDFDIELRDGVVKYPTTPMPGEWGNTLIFGHTSQERREKNPYGTVFSNLPKLQAWDEIKLVWKGELYKYKIVETVIRRPKDVDKEFQKRQNMDKEYITLMWCYPLGTTRQRMMVMAERVY